MILFRHTFLAPDHLDELEEVRELFLGPAEEMTSTAPEPDHLGCLKGGTAFERCGQQPIKRGARCYSLTVTHQRARALVGPAGGGKFYGDLEDLNLEIRGKVTKVWHALEFSYPSNPICRSMPALP